MNYMPLDTHKTVKRFQEAGFTEVQAEVMTDVVRETNESGFDQLATKDELKGEIRGLRSDMNAEFQEVRNEISLVRKDLAVTESNLRSEINLLKWMVGVIIAGILSLVLKAYF